MKNKNFVRMNIGLLILFCTVSIYGQNDNEGGSSNFSMGADLVSRYVWRGINLGGSSPHLQPYMEYSVGETGLTVGAWGSYSMGLGLAGTEADLFITYTPIDFLSVTVTDYFFPADTDFERNDYFNYKEDETGHTIEAMIDIGGTDNFPVYATFAVNLYGDDGLDKDGENYFAKYLEVGYSTTLNEYDFSVFTGFALDDPDVDEGAIGWYGDSAWMINLGVSMAKSYNIADIEIPLSSSLIFNPEAGNIYLVLAVSF